MQEVSYWVWGLLRSPGNHPEWPPACSVLHQSTSCIPPVLCVWSAWVGWRQQACLWRSLCMGVHSRCFAHGCVHVMQAVFLSAGAGPEMSQFSVKLQCLSWLQPPSCPSIAWAVVPRAASSRIPRHVHRSQAQVSALGAGQLFSLLVLWISVIPISCLPCATHCHQSHPGECPGTIGLEWWASRWERLGFQPPLREGHFLDSQTE